MRSQGRKPDVPDKHRLLLGCRNSCRRVGAIVLGRTRHAAEGTLCLIRLRRRVLSAAILVLALFAAPVPAYAEDTIKIAYTDPMSGPFGQVGQQTLQQMQYILDKINAKGGRSVGSSSWSFSTTRCSHPRS